MKKCYFCNGDIEKKSIDFDFWWEGDLVVFQKVLGKPRVRSLL